MTDLTIIWNWFLHEIDVLNALGMLQVVTVPGKDKKPEWLQLTLSIGSNAIDKKVAFGRQWLWLSW